MVRSMARNTPASGKAMGQTQIPEHEGISILELNRKVLYPKKIQKSNEDLNKIGAQSPGTRKLTAKDCQRMFSNKLMDAFVFSNNNES
mmetsp:Transcript_30330/g.56677  ORF Transcript_30330/g.56677 Transcript_30330/m.56677 type:complete len:88 (+) Transcript_30330:265-528(+)